MEIDFAHQSFLWDIEANTKAQVHVVIIGFSFSKAVPKRLFQYERNQFLGVKEAENINGYLVDAPSIFIDKRSKPLCDVPAMVRSCQPSDGGNLLMSQEEHNQVLLTEPELLKWIRPFSMGEDFIKSKA